MEKYNSLDQTYELASRKLEAAATASKHAHQKWMDIADLVSALEKALPHQFVGAFVLELVHRMRKTQRDYQQ